MQCRNTVKLYGKETMNSGFRLMVGRAVGEWMMRSALFPGPVFVLEGRFTDVVPTLLKISK